MDILCADTKLNTSRAYLQPGFAFGGSCLPKDLKALTSRAAARHLTLPLLSAAHVSNEAHMDRAVAMVERAGHRAVLLLGLTFKPHTDDLRDSPLVILAQRLVSAGFTLSVFDKCLTYDSLTGRNRQFLQAALPRISTILVSSLAVGLQRSDTVIVGHRSSIGFELAELAEPRHQIIDLVSGNPRLADHDTYQGICW